MSPAPAVTVVIPTRNRARYLVEAVECALSQTLADLETIVVDDASTDGTAGVLAGVGDERLRVLRHERPAGVAQARNAAIAAARGAWVAFLDDDDLWAPCWLERARADAGQRDADLVYGARLIVDAARRPVRAVLAPRPERSREALRSMNAFGGPSAVVVRTALLRDAGGFDPRFSALADWELWLRLADVARPAAVPDLLIAYTLYERNMHVTQPRSVMREFRRMVALHGPADGAMEETGFMHRVAEDNRAHGRRGPAAALYAEAAVRHRAPLDLLRAAACVRPDRGASREAPLWSAPSWLVRYQR